MMNGYCANHIQVQSSALKATLDHRQPIMNSMSASAYQELSTPHAYISTRTLVHQHSTSTRMEVDSGATLGGETKVGTSMDLKSRTSFRPHEACIRFKSTPQAQHCAYSPHLGRESCCTTDSRITTAMVLSSPQYRPISNSCIGQIHNQDVNCIYVDYSAVEPEESQHVDPDELSRQQRKRRCYDPKAQREDLPWEEYLPTNHKARGGVTISFPMKLHKMLDCIASGYGEEKQFSRMVSWLPHGRAFMVHDAERFEQTLLPLFFGDNMKYHSFKRQLNLYEFKRILHGHDENAYYHELCLRGKPFLCYRMKRNKIKGRKKGFKPKAPHTPNFYDMPMPDLASIRSSPVNFCSSQDSFHKVTPCIGNKESALSLLCGVAVKAEAMISPRRKLYECRASSDFDHKRFSYDSEDRTSEERCIPSHILAEDSQPKTRIPCSLSESDSIQSLPLTTRIEGNRTNVVSPSNVCCNEDYTSSDKDCSRKNAKICEAFSTASLSERKSQRVHEPTNGLTLLKAATLVELGMHVKVDCSTMKT